MSTANSEVKPLLAVDDEQLGDLVGSLSPIWRVPDLGTGLPEHQCADRIAAVHRVEEIPGLRRRPDERPLDVGQRDAAVP